MLEFGTERQGPRGESVVPMINVVFLLLIFFLMSARLTPSAPFETAPPAARGGEPISGDVLYLARDGRLAYGDARGEAVFARLRERDAEAPLILRADGGVEAARVVRLAARLAAEGVGNLRVVTVPR